MANEQLTLSESSIPGISPDRLLEAVACRSFLGKFNLKTLRITQPFDHALTETGAFAQVQEGVLFDGGGQCYPLRWTRDRYASLFQLFAPDGQAELIHLGLRDRRDDGKPVSTPPKFLREIGGLSDDQIPAESLTTGATNWYYASPQYDTPPAGIRAAEFSIGSADDNALILSALRNGDKAQRLYDKDPEKLTAFIEDPFACIPGRGAKPEEIDSWYRNWWQVVNRGLRGKPIPYPGQSSQHGFEGFFQHVVHHSVQILKEMGYTHLSGVPSYHHVWRLNLEHGFEPENAEIHSRALQFENALLSIPLPEFDKQDYPSGSTLHDTLARPGRPDRTRSPLMSWYALLPFILMTHPDHRPVLNINHGMEEQFQEAFQKALSSFVTPSGIISYPLAPGQNLWHSKPLA